MGAITPAITFFVDLSRTVILSSLLFSSVVDVEGLTIVDLELWKGEGEM